MNFEKIRESQKAQVLLEKSLQDQHATQRTLLLEQKQKTLLQKVLMDTNNTLLETQTELEIQKRLVQKLEQDIFDLRTRLSTVEKEETTTEGYFT